MYFVVVDLDHTHAEDGRIYSITRHGSYAQCEKKYKELRKTDQAHSGWCVLARNKSIMDLFKRTDDMTLERLLYHPDTLVEDGAYKGHHQLHLLFQCDPEIEITCFDADHCFEGIDGSEEFIHFDELFELLKIDSLAVMSEE